jgi:hypothetical protein
VDNNSLQIKGYVINDINGKSYFQGELVRDSDSFQYKLKNIEYSKIEYTKD